MDKNKISIATISWARDEAEETLLKRSLQQLASLNIPVFITDGGSGNEFLNFLKSIPQFTLLNPVEKGVWPQVKNSLINAHRSGAEFIFYTEPDKFDFFKNTLPQMIHETEMNERSGILLASRSKNAFATFPAFQQMTETTINNCCNEITRKSFDYTYGPFLLNKNLFPHIESLQPTYGWGWRPYTFIIAHRLGYTTDAYVGDFFCPDEQQSDNPKERIYRMHQLTQNIDAIILSASINI